MSKTPEAWRGRLDPLDVVYCCFPEAGGLAPPPKPRPALVLNVNDEAVPQRIEVAYGTSQRTSRKYSGEFELGPKDGPVFAQTGLTEETKFDLGRTVWLPYNDRWFRPRPSMPLATTPKLGKLDLRANRAIERRFIAAAKAAGLLDRAGLAADEGKISE